mmetsp:Transcript_24223/g.42584  ORF Transcript_24223/g.42584 Transcript_24223/m.42584 type:complete len:317 (+) Transcript_24223:813-1763(+)
MPTEATIHFFLEYDESKRPRNLLEEVIVGHLLPRAQQVLDGMKDRNLIAEGTPTKICGFEWWAHTRPIQANLGHNLHFDTDESMLDQEGKVTHPILSSVLYLTGGRPSDSSDPTSPAGATIILNQTPDSEKSADFCWQGIPHDNSFLLFPGDRLHGVLPCPGNLESENIPTEEPDTLEAVIHGFVPPPSPDIPPPHRLTFMVGFWTRNVPATMKNRRLYGPCGPLPSPSKEHTWVGEIMNGYNDHAKDKKEQPITLKPIAATALPSVSPAWESFQPHSSDTPPLSIPHGIDHRFFVQGAPQCFRQSLFEDRDEIEC